MENKYSTDFDFQAKVQSDLAGELNEAEKMQLKALTSSDTEAQEEYVFSEKLSKTLKNQEVLAVSALIGSIIDKEGLPDVDDTDDIPNDTTPPQYFAPVKAGSSMKMWLIGSASVLLIGLGVYGMYNYNTKQEAKAAWSISESYLKPLDDVIFSNTPKQGIADIEEGMKAYNEKDYNKAIAILGKNFQRTKDPNVGLYLAISILMNNGSALEAEALLLEILPQFSSPIKETAEWYLAMAKLKGGKHEEAITLLENMNSDSPYGRDAKELLIKLANQREEKDN
jgi:hypothetical protein